MGVLWYMLLITDDLKISKISQLLVTTFHHSMCIFTIESDMNTEFMIVKTEL